MGRVGPRSEAARTLSIVLIHHLSSSFSTTTTTTTTTIEAFSTRALMFDVALPTLANHQPTVDPFSRLPHEIVLDILETGAFSPLDLTTTIAGVARKWCAYVAVEHVWYALAVKYNLVPPHTRLSDAVTTRPPVGCGSVPHMAELAQSSWRSYVQLYDLVARQFGTSLSGEKTAVPNFPLRALELKSPGPVWAPRTWEPYCLRILSDQRHMVLSGLDGGLQVRTLDSNELVWSLPASQIPPKCQLEYSDGWLAVICPPLLGTSTPFHHPLDSKSID